MLKRGPILGLIYRLVISLFIFRRKPTSGSSRGLCCEEADYKEQNYSKHNFDLIHKLSVILISFVVRGKRFVVGEKGGVAASRKLSCGKARNLFETRTISLPLCLKAEP